MQNQDTYDRASRRVVAKVGFYIHLAVYLAVNILLAILNLIYSPQYLWFLWPLFGWGIGIAFHALGVFFFLPGSRLKERMIRREMERSGKT